MTRLELPDVRFPGMGVAKRFNLCKDELDVASTASFTDSASSGSDSFEI